MTSPDINFGGTVFLPLLSGGLYWPEKQALIISDMHLEKGSSYLKYGLFLPPYDTVETLKKLNRDIAAVKPQSIIFLGDILHDKTALQRINATDLTAFDIILERHQIIWVEGNHDTGTAPPNVKIHSDYMFDNIAFRHIAEDDADLHEISGHYHPCTDFTHKGQRLRRPCFAVSQNKIIMPSYGAYTGGLDIKHPAIQKPLGPAFSLYVLGHKKLYRL